MKLILCIMALLICIMMIMLIIICGNVNKLKKRLFRLEADFKEAFTVYCFYVERSDGSCYVRHGTYSQVVSNERECTAGENGDVVYPVYVVNMTKLVGRSVTLEEAKGYMQSNRYHAYNEENEYK